MMRKLAVALVLAAIGCGGSGTGGPGGTNSPTVHALYSNQPMQFAAGTAADTQAFSLPTGAVVDFSIVDTPTGIGSDHMDVAIATAASASTTSPVLYGQQKNVTSTSGSTQPLPADDYVFYAVCNNFTDDCIFNLTLNATY